jgi:hypothetical protein
MKFLMLNLNLIFQRPPKKVGVAENSIAEGTGHAKTTDLNGNNTKEILSSIWMRYSKYENHYWMKLSYFSNILNPHFE